MTEIKCCCCTTTRGIIRDKEIGAYFCRPCHAKVRSNLPPRKPPAYEPITLTGRRVYIGKGDKILKIEDFDPSTQKCYKYMERDFIQCEVLGDEKTIVSDGEKK